MSGAIPYKKLSEFCDLKRPSLVKKWCQDRGVLYFLDAKNRPCTTETALHEALERGRNERPHFI